MNCDECDPKVISYKSGLKFKVKCLQCFEGYMGSNNELFRMKIIV